MPRRPVLRLAIAELVSSLSSITRSGESLALVQLTSRSYPSPKTDRRPSLMREVKLHSVTRLYRYCGANVICHSRPLPSLAAGEYVESPGIKRVAFEFPTRGWQRILLNEANSKLEIACWLRPCRRLDCFITFDPRGADGFNRNGRRKMEVGLERRIQRSERFCHRFFKVAGRSRWNRLGEPRIAVLHGSATECVRPGRGSGDPREKRELRRP